MNIMKKKKIKVLFSSLSTHKWINKRKKGGGGVWGGGGGGGWMGMVMSECM